MVLNYLLVPSPQPLSGPLREGYPFSVIAMKGNEPVELLHEWLVRELDIYPDLDSYDKHKKSEIIGSIEARIKHPIVWADTGRAIKPYRYYLTESDLHKINFTSYLKSGEDAHRVRVKILENDPKNERQTLRVIVDGDLNKFINVYQVENGKVKPLKWLR